MSGVSQTKVSGRVDFHVCRLNAARQIGGDVTREHRCSWSEAVTRSDRSLDAADLWLPRRELPGASPATRLGARNPKRLSGRRLRWHEQIPFGLADRLQSRARFTDKLVGGQGSLKPNPKECV